MTERPDGTPDAAPAEPDTPPETETGSDAAEPAAPAPAAPETEDDSELADAGDDATDEIDADVPAPTARDAAAAGASVRPQRGGPPPSVQRAPTQSELAVRVTDNVSRFFVIATVVIFVAILLYGLVGGVGGLLTTTPQPATAAPSVSAEPPASPAASPSVAPSESPASASPS